jgi:hypothetical protein
MFRKSVGDKFDAGFAVVSGAVEEVVVWLDPTPVGLVTVDMVFASAGEINPDEKSDGVISPSAFSARMKRQNGAI